MTRTRLAAVLLLAGCTASQHIRLRHEPTEVPVAAAGARRAVETQADFARHATADVLVLGTHYRAGQVRLLVGSSAERLPGQVRCNVLAVHPEGFAADLARHLGLERRAARRAA